MSISTLASALSTNHPTGFGACIGGGRERRAAEVLGVGEAQRRVVAVDDQAGDGLRVRVVVDVVHAGDARHVPEDGVVRAGHPAQQIDDRQATTATSTPYSTPSTSTATVVTTAISSSLRRNRAIRRNSPTSISRIAAKITTAPSAAVGKRGQHGPAEREDQHDDHHGDQRVQLGPAALRVADGGPAAAAADREPADQPGQHVARAERHELRLASTSWPLRAANDRAVSMLSE